MSDWWASLRHGGLLLSPSKVAEFFPQGPEPLPAWLEERLRRDLARLEVEGGESRLLDTVLEQVLGLGGRADADSGAWVNGGALSAEWTRRSITGEAVRPRRVWQGPHGAVLPVFFDDQAKRLAPERFRAPRVVPTRTAFPRTPPHLGKEGGSPRRRGRSQGERRGSLCRLQALDAQHSGHIRHRDRSPHLHHGPQQIPSLQCGHPLDLLIPADAHLQTSHQVFPGTWPQLLA